MAADEERDGVPLTNLDQPLFDGADATKRELVDYLDAARDRFLPGLRGRPLSVVRVLRGQRPFMQKNLPRYAPPWLPRVSMWGGEVVVVNEKFGIRLTDVISPAERIRKLK